MLICGYTSQTLGKYKTFYCTKLILFPLRLWTIKRNGRKQHATNNSSAFIRYVSSLAYNPCKISSSAGWAVHAPGLNATPQGCNAIVNGAAANKEVNFSVRHFCLPKRLLPHHLRLQNIVFSYPQIQLCLKSKTPVSLSRCKYMLNPGMRREKTTVIPRQWLSKYKQKHTVKEGPCPN